MNIRVNLAERESRTERTVYLWASVGVLLGAALLIHFFFVAGRQVKEYEKVHRAVLQYQAESREFETKENSLRAVLRQPATLKLYSQINFLNSLIEERKVSLSGLTLEVSKLLPDQVRITGLSLADAAGGPVVEISVEGSVRQVTGVFLNNLEASPDFDAVTVLDQAFETQSEPGNLVSLTCSARYIGSLLPGAETDRGRP